MTHKVPLSRPTQTNTGTQGGATRPVVVLLFAALPVELIKTLAGLALLATIGQSLGRALADDSSRDAALVTFLCTASGVVLGGIGSAFWGLIAGVTVLAILRLPNRRRVSEVK